MSFASAAQSKASLAGKNANLEGRRASGVVPPPRPSSPHGPNLRARLLARKSSAVSLTSGEEHPAAEGGQRRSVGSSSARASAQAGVMPQHQHSTRQLAALSTANIPDEELVRAAQLPEISASEPEGNTEAAMKRSSSGSKKSSHAANGATNSMPVLIEESKNEDEDQDDGNSMGSFSRRYAGSITRDESQLPDRKVSSPHLTSSPLLGMANSHDELHDTGRYSTMTVMTRRTTNSPPPMDRARTGGGKSATSRSGENANNLGMAAAMFLGTNMSNQQQHSDGEMDHHGGIVEASVASTAGDSLHSGGNRNSENANSEERDRVGTLPSLSGSVNPLNIVVSRSASVAATAGGGRDENSQPASPIPTNHFGFGSSFDAVELAQRMLDGKDMGMMMTRRYRSPSEEAARPSVESPPNSPQNMMGKFLLARLADASSSPMNRMSTANSIAAVRDDDSRMGEYSGEAKEDDIDEDDKDLNVNGGKPGEKQLLGRPSLEEESETVHSNAGTQGSEGNKSKKSG